MDYEFDTNERRYTKLFFNKYSVYVLLGILLCVNIVFFPDLLNHKDIKLNDMSFLVEHARKQREEIEVNKIKNNNVEKKNKSLEIEIIPNNIEGKPAVAINDSISTSNPKIQDENKITKEDEKIKFMDENKSTTETKNKRNYYYIAILSLILLALLISFGIFIYNNINVIRATFLIGKNTNLRDYVYPGYQLLVD
jgi:hypothetical protein